MSADAKTTTPLPYVLLVLTFTTGLVDAVSFLGLGRVFTALMTGNVVFTAFAFAGADGLSASHSLAALGAFLVGAAIGGRVARRASGRSGREWLGRSAVLEVLLVVSAASVGLLYPFPDRGPEWALYVIVALLSTAMGLRNATVLKLGLPDLKTTVLTLTLTGIAADSPLGGGQNPRLGWRLASVTTLGAGGLVGALTYFAMGIAVPLFGMAVLVALATTWYATHPSSLEPVGGRRVTNARVADS